MHPLPLMIMLLSWLLLTGTTQAQDWQRIGPDGGVVYTLEVPDPDGERAYLIGAGGLFRSDDRGATWSLMPSPSQDPASQYFSLRAFSRSDADAIVIGRPDRLWRSTDGGHTWRDLVGTLPDDAQLSRITAVAVDPDDARRVAVFMVAGHQYGSNFWPFSALWLSEDGERPALFEQTVNRDPQCRGIIRNGFDHVNVATFESGELHYGHLYTCDPHWGGSGRPDYYLMRWNHPMYRWLPPQFAIGPNTTLPGKLVGADGKLYLSIWGGRVHRLDVNDNSVDVVRDHASSLQTASDGSVIVGGSDGLFRSTDQGMSWRRMDDGTQSVPGFAMQTGPAAVFTSPTRWLAAGVDGVFQSANADGPWQPSQRGFTGFPARTVAIVPDDERRIWAGSMSSRRVLQRTGDGGGTWQTSDLPSIAELLRSIVVDPATTADSGRTVLYATGRSCPSTLYCPDDIVHRAGVFKSVNSGANWQLISGDLPLMPSVDLRRISLAADPTSSQPRLLLTGQHHLTSLVVLSRNGGQNWRQPDSGLPAHGDDQSSSQAMDVRTAPSDGRRIYLATQAVRYGTSTSSDVQRNGVFSSDDGGITWTHRSDGLPLRPGSSSHGGAIRLAIHPRDPDVLWTITSVEDAEWPYTARFYVYRSGNGGLSWSQRSTGLDTEQKLDIAIDPDNPQRIYLAAVNGVFHSTDDGLSWQRLGSRPIHNVTSLAIGPRHLFAGTYLGVQKILKPGQTAGPEPCPVVPAGTSRRSLDPRCSGRLFDLPPR